MIFPWTAKHGRASFSLVKHIATNPATFLAECHNPTPATSAMRLGTMGHWALLGGPRTPLIYRESKTKGEGARTNWEKFQAEHEGQEIFSLAEEEEGRVIANAIRTAPHNRKLFETYIDGGEFEIPLEFEICGIPMRTRGVDVLHRTRDLFVDFKTSRSADPELVKWQAKRMHWDEQLAIYSEALKQNGFEAKDHGNFVTHSARPYVSIYRHVRPAVLADAMQRVLGWFQTLHKCLDRDEWPGFAADTGGVVEAEMGPVALQGLDELEEAS